MFKFVKVTQKTLILATVGTLIVGFIITVGAMSYIDWSTPSRAYTSSVVPIRGRSMSSITDAFEIIESIIEAFVISFFLTALLTGLFLKFFLHVRNGLLLVFFAEILLVIITWPLTSSSEAIKGLSDFVFDHPYVWLPLLAVYLYLFYSVTLRYRPSKPPKTIPKIQAWNLN